MTSTTSDQRPAACRQTSSVCTSGAPAGVKAKKAAFERNPPPVKESVLFTFKGVDGWDVYNCSIPFTSCGRRYLFGRVERRDQWARSHVSLFEATGVDEWAKVAGFTDLDLEDPYVQTIGGELVVGGTFVTRHADGTVKSYLGRFYRGADPFSLKFFLDGPDRMKDIRLVEFPDGRVGVFTRPRGEDVRAKYGSEAVIGYFEAPSLDAISADAIEKAEAIDGILGKDEWGGCNQIYLRPDGKLLAAAHLSASGEPAANGQVRQIYCNAAFVFDPATRKASHVKIVATRRLYPACEPKVPHLDDCVFTSGFVFRDDGFVDVYTGVGDARQGRVTLPASVLPGP